MSEDAEAIIKNLLRTGAYLQRTDNRILSRYGLKQQQFVVLNEITTRGKINQKQLVGRLLFEKSNISKIIKKLKLLKLIQTRASPEDQRVVLLEVTPHGRDIWQKCMSELNTWSEKWLEPLNREEIKEARYILEKLNKLALSDNNHLKKG